MPQNVKGTFAAAPIAVPDALSDTLVIPSGITAAVLSLNGALDESDSVEVQKTLDNGQTWLAVETYAAPQSRTAFSVAHGEQWRLMAVGVPGQPISYSLSAES